MNVVFIFDEKVVSRVVMTWRPEKGDKIAVGGKVYKVDVQPFLYDGDNAIWEVQLDEA